VRVLGTYIATLGFPEINQKSNMLAHIGFED